MSADARVTVSVWLVYAIVAYVSYVKLYAAYEEDVPEPVIRRLAAGICAAFWLVFWSWVLIQTAHWRIRESLFGAPRRVTLRGWKIRRLP